MASFLNKFLKDVACVVSSNIVSTFISLAASLLIVASLTVSGYGLVALSLSALNILSMFLDLGLFGVVIADVSHERGLGNYARAKKILISYSKAILSIGIMISIVLFFLSKPIATYLSKPDITGLLQIASLMLMLYSLREIFNCIFQSSLYFKYSSLIVLLEAIFRLGFVVTFLYVGYFDTSIALLCYGLAILATLTVMSPLLVRVFKRHYSGVETDKTNLLNNIISGHGKFAMIQRPIVTLGNHAPIWILQIILGSYAVGLFALANKLNSSIRIFLESIERVLIPTISKEIATNRERVKRIFVRGIKYGGVIAIMTLLPAVLLMDNILMLLGLHSYLESVPVFRVLVLTIVIAGLSYPLRPLLYGLKAQKQLATIYLIRLVSLIVLGIILCLWLREPTGIALAILLANALNSILRYFALLRIDAGFKIRLREIFSIDEYDKALFRRVLKGIRARTS